MTEQEPVGPPRTDPVLYPLLHLLSEVWYMFQCHSPKSSHLPPLPQSPKDYSMCVRVLEAKHTEQTSQLDSLTWLSREAGQMPGPGHVQGWAGQQAPRVLVNGPH